MKQTRTTLKELTARYRSVLLKCALINLMLCSAAGAASIDVTDSVGNRYLGSFGVPLKIYDSDTSIGTYYAAASDLMGNATISGVTATLNNNSHVGSGNLSWTQSTGKYSEIEFNTLLTETEMKDSRDRIKTVLSAMNDGAKNYDALPAGIKEALQVSYGGGITCAEYLQTTWENGSSADINSIGTALYYPDSESGAYAEFNSDMKTGSEWIASVSITNSTLTLNGTSAIVNRTQSYELEKGNISISGSTIITTGANSFETYTGTGGNVSLTGGSSLQVNSGSTLTIQSKENIVSLTDSNLTLNGTITGNVSLGGTVALSGTGTISGNLNTSDSSVLDMKNSAIDSITVGTMTGGAGSSIKLDVNAVAGTIDHLTATSFTGTITISDLNFLSDERSFTLTVLNGDASGAVLALSSDVSSAYNSGGSTVEWRNNLTAAANWETAFTKTKYTIDTSRTLTVQDNKKLVFTVTNGAETQGETVSLGDTLALLNTMDSATRTLTNSTSAANYTVMADLGTTAAGTFTINGAKSDSSAATINMDGHTGFSVASGATLNLQNIVFSGNTAADGSVLTVSGGAAELSNVTIGNAVSVTSGTLTLSGGNSLGGLANAGTVTLMGANAVGAMSGAGTLTNNGNLTLTGATNGQIIGGTGRTFIDANLTTDATINQAITINGDKTLTANADKIGGAVTNGGTLALTGGTLTKSVSGGAVQINGNVASNVSLDNVTISAGNKLTVGAANIGTGLINNGTLALTDGTLTKAVSGTIHIDGTVTSNVLMENATITSGNTLTIGASNIGANLENNGTVSVTGGTLSNALSGSVSVTGTVLFGAGADLSGAQIDLTNGTLDIGENVLSVNTVTGGTVSLTLKETAESSALITAASANNVMVAPDMSRVSRKVVQHYILTSTDTGYSLILNNTGRYAVSKTPFEKSQAASMTHFDVSSWTGGDLYVMRISSVALIAYQDLIEAGYSLTPNETNAVSVMADDVTELLPAGYQGAVDIVNGRLETAVAERNYAQMLQAFREVGEEASPAVVQTAQSNAEAVMSVVANRLNGSAAAVSGTGRSGGDYTVGASSVWAQGMLNAAELNGTNGFKSDTAGFAAGFEYNINDSYKAGIGYAFSSTDIKTGRSKTSVDTHTGFVYGEYAPDAFFVNGVLSYGRSAYDEKTKMLGLKSDFKTDAFAVQMMSGYVLKDFTPEAGLRYINVREKAYTNALGARTAGKNLQTWTAVAGVKTAKEFRLETGMLTAHGKAALTYDLRRGNPDRTVVLANGSSYVAQEENMKRFGLEAGAGISYKLVGKTELSVSYEGRFKKHYVDHTGMLSIKYAF